MSELTSERAPGKSTEKHPGQPADPKREMPETIRLLLLLWSLAIGGEVLHQILNVVISLIDPSPLLAMAREGLSDEEIADLGEATVTASAYSSVILIGLMGLLIMGLLAWGLTLIKRRSKHAGTARRLLLFFGIYFGIRILLVFMAPAGGGDVPVIFYLVDGSLQILVGVAAVLGLIFSFRIETMRWTREVDSDKPGRD